MNIYHFAEDKYSEALFFLRLMKKNTDKVSNFRYYFSAFLSAARSVSFVWKEVSKKNKCFAEMYSQYFEKDLLMDFFVTTRNRYVHDGNMPLDISQHRYIGEIETEFGDFRWSFKNFPDDLSHENNVISVADEVLVKLGNFLLEIRSRFPEQL